MKQQPHQSSQGENASSRCYTRETGEAANHIHKHQSTPVAEMGDTLEFNEIYQEVKGSWNDGRLRFSKQNVVYKSSKTGKVDSIPAGELNLAQWRRVCLGHGIKLGTSTGHIYKYDGFRDTDFEKISEFSRLFAVEPEKEQCHQYLSINDGILVPCPTLSASRKERLPSFTRMKMFKVSHGGSILCPERSWWLMAAKTHEVKTDVLPFAQPAARTISVVGKASQALPRLSKAMI
ncbi:FACT complex subunit SSRP1a isoform X1 [Lates japonicus]|uniref:FACT complex subunit SSRP1a isoform X1 n=1 Tax=Lates japonicus TaxID=270547 RepID=A0AAD3NEL9_LATJO|nr:FACT complex subunit SSRP1a isoform X1 [Lates japonicus]